MNPDWRKVDISEAESGLMWIEVSGEEDDVSCTCYFTDLVNIYSEHLNKTSLETRFKENNTQLETDDYQDFFSKVKTALSQGEESTISVTKEKDSYNIDMEWRSEGFDWKWLFRVDVGSAELFYKLVTYPVISGLHQLRQDKDTLLAVIRAKDFELEDHENSGSKLSLPRLRTARFDPETLKTGSDSGEVADVVSFLDQPGAREVLSNVSVKILFEKKSENKQDLSSTKESIKVSDLISEPPPPAVSQEPNCRKKIKLEKPNLSQIATNSNRFNKPKKKF